MADYTYKDIKNAYKEIGVTKNRIVFLETDFAGLGIYEVMDKERIANAHLRALKELLGKDGTIIAHIDTLPLCNTEIPFDVKKTPSDTGIFSEYLRRSKGTIRSFHPFVSFAALGKQSHEICGDVSRHAFGPETPMARMVERDTLFLSVGLHPRITCSTLHQVEMDTGIPYRYVREYMHPVVRKSGIRREAFYMYVWYHECDIKKNDKTKLWGKFQSKHEVKQASLGRGKVYSYSMREFYRFVLKLFKDDMYILVKTIPKRKPYRRKM